MKYPVTKDGRYFIVRDRLWRMTDPALPAPHRDVLTRELMSARRAVGTALRNGDADGLALARSQVQAAKVALGERGPVWWTDGTPDLNRHLQRNTHYGADDIVEPPGDGG